MSYSAQLFVLAALVFFGGQQLFAQPVTDGDTGGGAWVGAGLWVAITAAFLIAMLVLVWKGLKRPNRKRRNTSSSGTSIALHSG